MKETELPDLTTTLRLVRSAQGGDREALDALFRRYAPRVFRIASLRVGLQARHFADYEDIAQEALLRAFRGLDGFDPVASAGSAGAFQNWLARCVETALKDQVRRQRTAKRGKGEERRFGDLVDENLSSTLFAGREPSPSAVAAGRELEERLEAALLALQDRYREVIILRQLCGLSYEEIQRLLGFRDEANVRTILHRALQKLETALAG